MLLLPQPVAQALVNYLQEQPFKHVHQLIGALMQLQPAPEPAAKSEPANGAEKPADEQAEASAN
jgi:hypothetical protein